MASSSQVTNPRGIDPFPKSLAGCRTICSRSASCLPPVGTMIYPRPEQEYCRAKGPEDGRAVRRVAQEQNLTVSGIGRYYHAEAMMKIARREQSMDLHVDGTDGQPEVEFITRPGVRPRSSRRNGATKSAHFHRT